MNTNQAIVIGNKIKEHRKKLNITQKELGEKIGVSESAISLYEAGKRIPNDDSKYKLAKLFNTTVDQLIYSEN